MCTITAPLTTKHSVEKVNDIGRKNCISPHRRTAQCCCADSECIFFLNRVPASIESIQSPANDGIFIQFYCVLLLLFLLFSLCDWRQWKWRHTMKSKRKMWMDNELLGQTVFIHSDDVSTIYLRPISSCLSYFRCFDQPGKFHLMKRSKWNKY